jgi:hypothetical protein
LLFQSRQYFHRHGFLTRHGDFNACKDSIVRLIFSSRKDFTIRLIFSSRKDFNIRLIFSSRKDFTIRLILLAASICIYFQCLYFLIIFLAFFIKYAPIFNCAIISGL